MRLAALEMIRILTNTILVEEDIVACLAEAAIEAEQAKKNEFAKLYWAMTRQRRVHLIELQARLAALREHYADIYHTGL